MTISNKKKLILVVEDDDFQAENIIELINSLKKYSTIRAKNGIEALALIKKHQLFFGFADNKINCVLLDIRMPVMNGTQFLKKLRGLENKHPLKRFLPVVFLTAFEDPEKWNSAIDNMVSAYLRKPFTKEQLKDVLNSILFNWDGETLVELTKEKGFDKISELRKNLEV